MRVTQAFSFEAAHFLPAVPEGHRCRELHGHSYRVELSFEGPVNQESGFVLDFFDIERLVAPSIGMLDHKLLNKIPGLENPTAENIALWIWNRAEVAMAHLAAIKIYETQNCWVEYTGS
jgi:6-pyruvoyltetrahydropterin/6-carboxytetrahydropterin synthase